MMPPARLFYIFLGTCCIIADPRMTTCPSPWYTASTEKECLHKDLKYTETFSILYLEATALTCVCVCVYECAGTCLCVTRLSYNKVAAHR